MNSDKLLERAKKIFKSNREFEKKCREIEDFEEKIKREIFKE